MSTQLSIKNELKQLGRIYASRRAVDTLKFAQERAFLEEHLTRGSWQLRQCTVESVCQSVLQAGSLGLSLNPILKHVYLIPRRIKKDPDIWACYASPSYMGLIHLAMTLGNVRQMAAEVVFEGDDFKYHGPLQLPTHSAVLKAKDRKPSNAIGVYAMARLEDGGIQAEYVDAETIQRIRGMSDQPDALMWTKFWTEGWRKAALRRMWKTLPKTQQMFHVEHHLNEHEGIDLPAERDITPESPPTITPDQLVDLRDRISKAGEDPEKWLKRLATRFGVEKPEALPAPQLEAARSLLDLGLKSAQGATQEAADAQKAE